MENHVKDFVVGFGFTKKVNIEADKDYKASNSRYVYQNKISKYQTRTCDTNFSEKWVKLKQRKSFWVQMPGAILQILLWQLKKNLKTLLKTCGNEFPLNCNQVNSEPWYEFLLWRSYIKTFQISRIVRGKRMRLFKHIIDWTSSQSCGSLHRKEVVTNRSTLDAG